MTGKELLEKLQKLTPEQLSLACVHRHTIYVDAEDSCGHEEITDLDDVTVISVKTDYVHKQIRNFINIGY